MFSRLAMLLIMTLTPLILLANSSQPSDTPQTTAYEVRDAKSFFDESFDDFQQELEVAKEEGKKGVLIMYEMDECPFCARMQATVLNRSDIQDFYKKHFRVLMVDVEGDLEMTDFAGNHLKQKDFALKNRVRATPVFQFFDLEGKPIKHGRLTGATKTAEEFMLFGQYIANRENEKQSFFQYKRKHLQKKPLPETQAEVE